MAKFFLQLESKRTGTLEIEAESKKEAEQKWLDGEYDNEIEFDNPYEQPMWDLKKIETE